MNNAFMGLEWHGGKWLLTKFSLCVEEPFNVTISQIAMIIYYLS